MSWNVIITGAGLTYEALKKPDEHVVQIVQKSDGGKAIQFSLKLQQS